MNQVRMNGYVRISKAEARRRYHNGEYIGLLPCKCYPGNSWVQVMWFNIDDVEEQLEGYVWKLYDDSFDYLLNNYEVYNCQYNETGKYPAFYKKEN